MKTYFDEDFLVDSLPYEQRVAWEKIKLITEDRIKLDRKNTNFERFLYFGFGLVMGAQAFMDNTVLSAFWYGVCAMLWMWMALNSMEKHWNRAAEWREADRAYLYKLAHLCEATKTRKVRLKGPS